MQVVHVARRFVPELWGGTETVLRETCQGLAARGHDSPVWCSAAFSAPGPEVCQGVQVRRFPHFYPYLGLSAEARIRLDQKGGNCVAPGLALALWNRPGLDVVHVHTGGRLGACGRWAARARGIPYLVTLHGGHFAVPAEERARLLAPLARALDLGKPVGWLLGSRRLLQDADAVICVGQAEYREASRLLAGRVEHLPNGVAVERFGRGDGARFRARHVLSPDAPVVLMVGRLDPQKNQEVLVRLWPALRERFPEAELVLVGEGTHDGYSAQLRRLAGPGVRFLGGLPPDGQELVDAFHAATCLALPSLHEPLGLVALEAWAAGCPVVAHAVGGLVDLVADGQDGLLVDPERPAAWLECLDTVLRDADLRGRLRGQARVKVARYAWPAHLDRLQALYQELREGRARASRKSVLRSWIPASWRARWRERALRAERQAQARAVDSFQGRILVLAPHYDDEVFGCGGTLCRHVLAGASVTVAFLTDGSQGRPPFPADWDEARRQLETESLKARRRQESILAAQRIGYTDLRFLEFPDGHFRLPDGLPQALLELLQEVLPDVVYLPYYADEHRDHRHCAVALARAAASLPRGFRCRLRGYEIWSAAPVNEYVDITEVEALKAECMTYFPSQLAMVDYRSAILALNRYRSLRLQKGRGSAEAFFACQLDELASWLRRGGG